jgi:hypothetical protein
MCVYSKKCERCLYNENCTSVDEENFVDMEYNIENVSYIWVEMSYFKYVEGVLDVQLSEYDRFDW